VAVLALQQGMRSYKRKAILVIANLFQRDLPALHRVATLAICAKLPAMDVGVTVGTAFAYVLEHETGVALRAAYFLMHATQWIPGVVVIEFRIGAYRLPTRVRVAILA
jgi:hypothetical protein